MTELWAPSAIRCRDKRNAGTSNAGKPFRTVLHTTQPLGNWKRGRRKGAAIFTTEASAKKWYEGFANPYTFLLCISELNSYDYFRYGKKKNQRDLDGGRKRQGFDALFQINHMEIPGWSMAGNALGGYPSNWVSAYTPQLAVMGCAEDVHTWDDVIYGKIAAAEAEIYQLMRTVEGYESVACLPYRWKGVGGMAYGSKGLGRMPVPSWLEANNGLRGSDDPERKWNMCAHSDLPGLNTYSGKPKQGQTHWDAPFNFDKLSKMINDILDPPPPPEPTPAEHLADIVFKQDDLIKLAQGLNEIRVATTNAIKLLPKPPNKKEKST